MAATPHNHAPSLVRLPGSDFIMGDAFDEDYARDGEVPVHPVRITGFELSPTPVTNRQFAAFVEATGYQTDAERFDSSAVFHLALQARSRDILGTAAGIGWWLNVHGADWAHPAGCRSHWQDVPDHPVVHVSWLDAVMYCQWSGTRLPTEAEWEYSARAGHAGRRFAWKDELEPDGKVMANIWHGADSLNMPLYEAAEEPGGPLLPMPMVNILSGGAHAAGTPDTQDILAVPAGATLFRQAIEWAWRVRRATAEAAGNHGHGTALVADEGGLGLHLDTNRSAVELVTEGISRAGQRPGGPGRHRGGCRGGPIAAGQFWQGDRYLLRAERRTVAALEFIDEIDRWRALFPVVSVEDVLGDDD